tara:strand:+ start:696 stop:1118 length:423 start_codon:yes stop_codon:yes gene_type:complete
MTQYSAAIDAQTGQGVTVSLTGVSGCVRSITMPTMTQEAIDVQCLDNTLGSFAQKIPGGLIDAGEIQVTCTFQGVVVPSYGQETATITFADGSSLSGTGFVSSVDNGSAEVGSLMEQTITFTFDGEIGPTATAAGGGGGS